eukprot:14736346-Ditylum_brightwellii.AAC.1
MGRRKHPTQQETQIDRRQRKEEEVDMEHDYLRELMEKGKSQKHPVYVMNRRNVRIIQNNAIIMSRLRRVK